MSPKQLDYSAPTNDFEEPEETARRLALGLRPTFYLTDVGRGAQDHPDKGPCPSWCWAAEDGYTHEVEPDRPMTIRHRSDSYGTVASLYRGDLDPVPDGEVGEMVTMTATVETHLERDGQSAPVVVVALRQRDEDRQQKYDEVLRLSIDDADELARVLAHLVGLA